MNPIAGGTPPQQGPKNMQNVVPSPRQVSPQPSAGANDAPIQTEIVNDLPVKAQETPSVQTRRSVNNFAGNSPSSSASSGQTGTQDDKGLDKVLKDVSQQIEKTDSQTPKPSIFKRWEPVFVTIIALIVAAALCIAAISAFKN